MPHHPRNPPRAPPAEPQRQQPPLRHLRPQLRMTQKPHPPIRLHRLGLRLGDVMKQRRQFQHRPPRMPMHHRLPEPRRAIRRPRHTGIHRRIMMPPRNPLRRLHRLQRMPPNIPIMHPRLSHPLTRRQLRNHILQQPQPIHRLDPPPRPQRRHRPQKLIPHPHRMRQRQPMRPIPHQPRRSRLNPQPQFPRKPHRPQQPPRILLKNPRRHRPQRPPPQIPPPPERIHQRRPEIPIPNPSRQRRRHCINRKIPPPQIPPNIPRKTRKIHHQPRPSTHARPHPGTPTCTHSQVHPGTPT